MLNLIFLLFGIILGSILTYFVVAKVVAATLSATLKDPAVIERILAEWRKTI